MAAVDVVVTGAASPREAMGRLQALIATLPIPTTPPYVPSSRAALGLSLLDLSLRLTHVSRLSEHLRLVDRGHMARSVSLDVDIAGLSLQQRLVLAASGGETLGELPGRLADRALWVPVSRYSRSDLAPVVVRDAAGQVVPRMTHRETKRASVAGFLRLFGMLVEAHLASTESTTPVHELEDHLRSRWLIEVAIAELVDSGSVVPVPPAPVAEGGRGLTLAGDPAYTAIRQRALDALDALLEPADHPFEQLVHVASRQYPLVVLLAADQPRQFLTWEAPLIPAVRPRSRGRRLLRAALPVNREFVVEYATTLPRAVQSYHVTVEVSEEIHVRRFLLSSNVDEPFLTRVVEDLRAIATDLPALSRGDERPDGATTSPPVKLAELELQGVASRMAELGRRRSEDLRGYEAYIDEASQRFGRHRLEPLGLAPHSPEEALAMVCAGDCSLSAMAAFGTHYAAGDYLHLATVLPPTALSAIADGMTEEQLGRDVTTDNDPREHGAHAHWRQPSVDLTPGSSEPVEAVAYLALADEVPALIESITRMVAALVLVVVGIGTGLSAGTSWLWPGGGGLVHPPKQADAIVAVLLLVPGILLSRLDLPSTNTVLGQLRRFQRVLATSSVVVTTLLAMVVATVGDAGDLTRWFELSTLALLVILGFCVCEFVMRALRRRVRVPRSARIPAWLRSQYPRPGGDAPPADAAFDTGGRTT